MPTMFIEKSAGLGRRKGRLFEYLPRLRICLYQELTYVALQKDVFPLRASVRVLMCMCKIYVCAYMRTYERNFISKPNYFSLWRELYKRLFPNGPMQAEFQPERYDLLQTFKPPHFRLLKAHPIKLHNYQPESSIPVAGNNSNK